MGKRGGGFTTVMAYDLVKYYTTHHSSLANKLQHKNNNKLVHNQFNEIKKLSVLDKKKKNLKIPKR